MQAVRDWLGTAYHGVVFPLTWVAATPGTAVPLGKGRRLEAMLKMGASRPWPDALEAMTGEREMDATAILEYFAPLKAWLDEQNQGHPVGW